MSDWQEVTLGEICSIEIGGTPSRSEERYWWKKDGDGVRLPWVSISDMKGKVITDTKESITETGALQSNCKHVPKGTLLMSFKLTIGRLAFAGRDLYTNEAISAIRPTTDVNPEFLYYGLQHWNLTGDSDQAVKGITLNKQKLQEIPCLLPPLPEQKKIAEILSGIDRAISDLRSKTLQITSCKHSVFSDLLAGRGRDTRQLKDGEWTTGVIGQADSIPCGWDIVNINDVAQLESGHTPSRRCPEYWGGRIPWISLADSKRLDRDYEITETSENTNDKGIANSSARLLPKGTVCLSRTASIGKCVIMGEEMATSQDFANFICGPRLHNYYLLFLFRHMQETWKMLSGGSTHQTIYMPIFQSLQIPVPTLAEQKSISDLMKSLDRAINTTLAKTEKLVHIKKSLGADLLSGRKRVSV